MRLTVISPEDDDPREPAAIGALLDAGLERYHVRKPAWDEARLDIWVNKLPAVVRLRLVLHGDPALAARLGLPCHAKDKGGDIPGAFGRSCHDLATLEKRLAGYPTLFFGPVFMSLTKGGYGPPANFAWPALQALLTHRAAGTSAEVYAIGGVTASGLARCQGLGFDGVAVLGAVWGERDPVAAFRLLQKAAAPLEVRRHAA